MTRIEITPGGLGWVAREGNGRSTVEVSRASPVRALEALLEIIDGVADEKATRIEPDDMPACLIPQAPGRVER